MSNLTCAWLRTTDEGRYVFRAALIHDYSLKTWPEHSGVVITDEMAWALTGSFDASDVHAGITEAEAAIDRLATERLFESDYHASFEPCRKELVANESFAEIRSRGVAWAAKQAAADPDRDCHNQAA